MLILEDGKILVDNGKAVLEDLDIAVPVEVATRQKRNIAYFAGSWDTLSIPYTITWGDFCKCKKLIFIRLIICSKQMPYCTKVVQ